MAKNNKKSTKSYRGNRNSDGKSGKFKPNKTGDSRGMSNCDKVLSQTNAYGGNDLSWYNRNPEFLEAAARIPFAFTPGRDISVPKPFFMDEKWDDQPGVFRYPGLYMIGFYPTVGHAENVDDAINVAARQIYGKVRAKYSGSLEADAPDMMMYLLAVDSLMMLIEDAKRAYYLINQYTMYNNYYPRAAIAACGYDFDDLLANREQFKSYLIEAIAMLSKFKVPNIMDLFKRHSFLCANIYADDVTTKSQHYIFRPAGFYRLAHVDEMTELVMVNYKTPDLKKVADWWKYFNDAIKILMAWDTSYTLLGYFERAYEGSEFLVPSPLDIDGVLTPIYNEEILLQIHNATILAVKASSLDITQRVEDNTLQSNPTAGVTGGLHHLRPAIPRSVPLSMPTSNQPNYGDIVIATRLTAALSPVYDVQPESVGLGDEFSLTCGTEILMGARYYLSVDGSYERNIYEFTHMRIPTSAAETSTQDAELYHDLLAQVAILSAFKYHPHIVFTDNRLVDGVADYHMHVFSDIDNLTWVDSQTLSNLHRVCVYSEFNCFN